MASTHAPASLRTLALVGPPASGKTTLAEALLWKAGVVGARPRVDLGHHGRRALRLGAERVGGLAHEWSRAVESARSSQPGGTPGRARTERSALHAQRQRTAQPEQARRSAPLSRNAPCPLSSRALPRPLPRIARTC